MAGRVEEGHLFELQSSLMAAIGPDGRLFSPIAVVTAPPSIWVLRLYQ